MNANRTRRFTLLDSLILIAATAVGLALLRWISDGADIVGMVRDDLISVPDAGWNLKEIYSRAWLLELLLAPCLVCWSLAHCILYLAPPRVPWRRARRQVGFLTSAMVVTATCATSLAYVECWWATGQPGALETEKLDIVCAGAVPLAVLAGWFVLALSGRWRAEPNWLDRLGRVLGWIWVAFLPLGGVAAAFL